MLIPQEESSYLVGLVGAGIAPSLSPALHERAADELGLRYLYRRIDLDERNLPATAVGDLVDAARAVGFRGLNITHPCKQLVIKHLDGLSAEAEALGAVNTVLFEDGRAFGHNTDVSGFAEAVRRGLPIENCHRTVLIGAGGAGAAVGHALLGMGAASVDVFDVDAERAAALAASLRGRFGPDRATSHSPSELDERLRRASGLVNATPTGMWSHPGLPVPAELLRSDLWVADVVYRPLDTELVTAARARGASVLTGGLMAVFQAAHAFHLFTGREPDTDRMLCHFDELVAAHDLA
ncbi:MAG TPA: shikimate dehydrogenase [Pseudonocardiaceae bacterium]|nr:shikimate dehydrogenase [Pseudonocardiaceae bacterium]